MAPTRHGNVDVRVLTLHGRVTAACRLENVRGTAFAAVGGLSAARLELLGHMPAWRLRRPATQCLAVEADGRLRTGLLVAGFREITSVRSHRRAPPGEPAATAPARHSLHDAETARIARRCEARVGFDYARGTVTPCRQRATLLPRPPSRSPVAVGLQNCSIRGGCRGPC